MMDILHSRGVRSLALPLTTVVLSIAIGVMIALTPTQLLPYVIGTCAFVVVTVVSLITPVLLLYFVILTSALGSLPRAFESVEFGTTGLTVSGLRWGFVAGIIMLVLGANARRARVARPALPFALFVLWATVRLVSTPLGTVGLKDVLFYALPPLIWVYTHFVISPHGRPITGIEKALVYSAFIPPLLYVLMLPFGLVQFTEWGPRGLTEPRTVASYLLVILSLSLALRRYGQNATSRLWGTLISLLALGTVLFTLSRMAILLGLLLSAMSVLEVDPRRLWRLSAGVFVAVALFAFLALRVPILQARFFHRVDSDLQTSLQYLRFSGRDVFWSVTFNHALEKPFVGWGPGSSRLLVARVVFQMERGEEYHPHNDYLRVFHDMGVIGLALLLLAWIPLLIGHWKGWKAAQQSRDAPRAKWNMSATLSIVVVLISSITGNTLHYVTVLGPVFIISAIAHQLNQKAA
jgi:O-antigen ligase